MIQCAGRNCFQSKNRRLSLDLDVCMCDFANPKKTTKVPTICRYKTVFSAIWILITDFLLLCSIAFFFSLDAICFVSFNVGYVGRQLCGCVWRVQMQTHQKTICCNVSDVYLTKEKQNSQYNHNKLIYITQFYEM